MTELAIVVPCYNEEATLPETLPRLLALLEDLSSAREISPSSRIYLVDDGSSDNTWNLIETAATDGKAVRGIKLSRNRGHQNALLAGLHLAEGDAVVSLDADLQDDLGAIRQMLAHHRNGVDVVYGVRRRREKDTWLKRMSAHGYYKLLRLMGADVVFDHADFRLLSRRAIDALKDYGEVNLFLRGMVPSIGFPSAVVAFDRHPREFGQTKYSVRKMFSLAINGVTSFTAAPLRIIAGLGLMVFVGSLLLSAWVLWTRFVSGDAIPGWASSVLPMYLMSGVQLLSIGVLGEYVAKIYMETKHRPRFIVEKMV